MWRCSAKWPPKPKRGQVTIASPQDRVQGRWSIDMGVEDRSKGSVRFGFSVLELLVVVAIMALLISIAVPAYNHVSRIGKRTKCAANLKSIGTAVQSFLTDNESMLPDALGRPAEQMGAVAAGAGRISPAPIYLLLAKELKSRSLSPGELETIRQKSG